METATATHPPKTDEKNTPVGGDKHLHKNKPEAGKPKEYTKEEREAAELRVVEENRKHDEEITKFVDDTAKQLEEKLKNMPNFDKQTVLNRIAEKVLSIKEVGAAAHLGHGGRDDLPDTEDPKKLKDVRGHKTPEQEEADRENTAAASSKK